MWRIPPPRDRGALRRTSPAFLATRALPAKGETDCIQPNRRTHTSTAHIDNGRTHDTRTTDEPQHGEIRRSSRSSRCFTTATRLLTRRPVKPTLPSKPPQAGASHTDASVHLHRLTLESTLLRHSRTGWTGGTAKLAIAWQDMSKHEAFAVGAQPNTYQPRNPTVSQSGSGGATTTDRCIRKHHGRQRDHRRPLRKHRGGPLPLHRSRMPRTRRTR